jgi:hypothetical protein
MATEDRYTPRRLWPEREDVRWLEVTYKYVCRNCNYHFAFGRGVEPPRDLWYCPCCGIEWGKTMSGMTFCKECEGSGRVKEPCKKK